ncbi:hypothetical protein K9M47_03575 [Candidatus Gracilibacteria bacterium]|nr:hypothetical protein [Candidatus Gracilibacteria bacterium]MCF7898535.1 hypothetical protein [Candidatus Paceibacterota bacterium]
MDWQTRRKLIYAIATILIVGASSMYLFRETIFPTPTCFDKKMNGYEIGVDCGGTCDLSPRCVSEIIPLEVMWARAIKSSSTTYDLVAMVSNKNINNAARNISYTFTTYDVQGLMIAETKGVTLAPINGSFPVIKQSIILNKEPTTVTLQIEEEPHYKVHEKPTSPTLRITNERYEAGDTPRVYATIKNTKRTTVSNLPIRVVLFNEEDNAYAVGETILPRLDKEEIKEISFTWRAALPSAPVRIRVYAIFDPFIAIE